MPGIKKSKIMLKEANRGEQYLLSNQPGRVKVGRIGWQPRNRGGQGILPLHTHDVANNIAMNGTSKRRYGKVRLVLVPEKLKKGWLKINEDKAKLNPLLPKFKAMSHNGPVYACLICSHFVSAQQLILEGGRKYRDDKDGRNLVLMDDDEEGKMIQESGVDAVVYAAELWEDRAAMLALMREDNLDAGIRKEETELDAFGHVCQIFNDIAAACGPSGKTITVDEVMQAVDEIGYGNMPSTGWRQLVEFRFSLSKPHSDMLFDALVQVCNGRVRTPPDTYANINNLHPKGHQWIKVFLVMETYMTELLSEEKGAHKKFTHAGPQPKLVRSLDPKAIKALGVEKVLLQSFTKFFTEVVSHYGTEAVEGESVEKRTLANATLMKSLGRVLWKVADALANRKRTNATAFNSLQKKCDVPFAEAAQDKETLIETIMKDRFADIEKRYGTHLEKAGVFSGDRQRPNPIYTKKPSVATTKGAQAMSHNEQPQAASAVRILPNGDISTAMSTSDVCKVLGLQGNGIGQLVAVKSSNVINVVGVAPFPKTIKIVSFNPPEVTILVEGVMTEDGDQTNIAKKLVVDIDDLLPLDAQEVTRAKPGPLQQGYQPHHPRVPSLDYIKSIQSKMKLDLQAQATSILLATAARIEEQVEVVYVPADGPEKMQGVFQCRVKKDIPVGLLRLYPGGDDCLHYTDLIQRARVEKAMAGKSCYMRGLQVIAKAKTETCVWTEEYIFYSAMSHKLSPLISVSLDDKVTCVRNFPAFWAVMLVGRDTKHMVNMIPYLEEYTLKQPSEKTYGSLAPAARITLRLPFLSNKVDLEKGDLLALPFDGGHASIFCEEFPALDTPLRETSSLKSKASD